MKKLSTLAAVALFLTSFGFAQTPNFAANANGRVMVSEYAKWSVHPLNAVAAGAATMTLDNCFLSVGTAGRKVFPLAVNVPVTVIDGTLTENVTPTAVVTPTASTGVSAGPNPFQCSFTATFANAHNSAASGTGVTVVSNDSGLEEAINDAIALGIGVVTIDSTANVTAAQMAAALVYPTIQIEDLRTPYLSYWNPTPSGTTTLAAPTTLTALTAVPSATPVGAYGTGTYFIAIAYVDALGNEGQPSASFSEAGLATGSFVFTAPAASTGAVGYVPYISLTGGTYALAYRVPLTSSICTLTKIETTIAACAVTNATYGQVGSAATVTAITVNTARLWVGLGGTSTTADYVGNSAARTTYVYSPSTHPAIPGVVTSFTAFAGATAPATTVPAVLGTIQLPAGFMNYVGKTIRVCGEFTEASAGSTATIVTLELLWDADGSDVTGAPVIVSKIPITATLVTANADQFQFCQNLKTTVSGAGVTAGSIQATTGSMTYSYGAATTVAAAAGPTLGAAAVGSLNLAGEGRIHITYLHTTGTDGAAPTLVDASLEVLN